IALVLGILSSELLLAWQQQNPIAGFAGNTIERVVAVFSSSSNTRILIFSLLIGALLAFVRESGGVKALVEKLLRRGIGKTRRQASMMTVFTGFFIFIESNLSVLTAGILSRGLFEKLGMSRARLAYLIDSTSAPVCIIILLNGWGAYVLGMLEPYELGAPSASLLWQTVPFNFYALAALALVIYTAWTGKVHGPLKRLEAQPQSAQDLPADVPSNSKSRYMLIPIATMVVGMIGFMIGTGGGDITAGDGSKSVLYATTLAAAVAYLMLLFSRRFGHQQLISIGFKGMGELLPLVCIVLLSLALGSSLRELG